MFGDELSIVTLRSLDAAVAQEVLNSSQIRTSREKTYCEVISEAMRMNPDSELIAESVQRDPNDVRPCVGEAAAASQDVLTLSPECCQCIADNHRQGYCHGDRCFLLAQYHPVAPDVAPSQVSDVAGTQASVEHRQDESLRSLPYVGGLRVVRLPEEVASADECLDFPLLEGLDLIHFDMRHLDSGGGARLKVAHADAPIEEGSEGRQFLPARSIPEPSRQPECDQGFRCYADEIDAGKVALEQGEQVAVVADGGLCQAPLSAGIEVAGYSRVQGDGSLAPIDLSIKQPVHSVPGFLGVAGAETAPVTPPVQRSIAPDWALAKPIPRAFLPMSPVQLEGIGLVQSVGTFRGSTHNHLQNQQVNWRKLVGVEPRYGTPDQSDQSLTSHTLGQEAAEVNAVGTERTEFEGAVKGIGLALALGAAFWLVILWRVM